MLKYPDLSGGRGADHGGFGRGSVAIAEPPEEPWMSGALALGPPLWPLGGGNASYPACPLDIFGSLRAFGGDFPVPKRSARSAIKSTGGRTSGPGMVLAVPAGLPGGNPVPCGARLGGD
jgi:hypothetical protein